MDNRLPLITPSASPPLSRLSPRKRQRSSDFDLHSARRDSSRRVLDVWSNLADRYSRRLDEDDIIDLRTVSLVKDRGVIRSSPQKFDFGDLTANDASSDSGQPVEDLDELDALATDESNKKKRLGNVPPLQPMDPTDAEDLRAFLEDEKHRKAQCGEEEEEEEEEEEPDPVAAFSDEDADQDPVADDGHDPDDALDPEPEHRARPEDNRVSRTPILVDSESEDELGKWDSDEGTKVYQLVKDDPESDSEVEIVSSILHPSESNPRLRKPASMQIPPVLTQLQTPPQSSSSVLENTPDDRNFEMPNLNPSSAKPHLNPICAGAEKSSTSNPTLNLTEIINQAKTRPRHAKSRGRLVPEVVVPRLASLRPKRQPIGETASSLSVPPNPPNESDSEVEIIEEQLLFPAQEKGKAKALPSPPPAEHFTPLSEESSDDPLVLVPSSSPRPTTPTQEKKRASPSSSPLWTPSRMTRPARTFSGRGKKRKRAWSSSEASDADNVLPPPESSSPILDNREDPGAFSDIDKFPSLASSSGTVLEELKTPTHSKGFAKTSRSSSNGAKVGRERHRFSRSGHRTEPSKTPTTTASAAHDDETVSEEPFPALFTPHEPHTPRQDRVVTRRRRHSARYSAPLPPVASSSATYNPFQDPRAQYIISHAMEQLSRLVTPAPMGVPTWPPPPLPPPQWEGEGYEPPLLQYQHGQWIPYTPRHRGSHRHSGSQYLSSSPPHSHSRSRSRSSSPTGVYDPAFSGGTVPPSSPDPAPLSSSPLSSPQLQLQTRPKSLVGRSKSRGRRVSFRLEGDGRREAGPEDGDDRIFEHDRPLRRSVSSSQIETVWLHGHSDDGGSPGRARRVRTSVRVREEEEAEFPEIGVQDEEDGEEEWSYADTEPVRGRRVLRAQTPGPPSRRPSLRPATPPRPAR